MRAPAWWQLPEREREVFMLRADFTAYGERERAADRAHARLKIAEIDAEFNIDNGGALDTLEAVQSAFRKVFG